MASQRRKRLTDNVRQWECPRPRDHQRLFSSWNPRDWTLGKFSPLLFQPSRSQLLNDSIEQLPSWSSLMKMISISPMTRWTELLSRESPSILNERQEMKLINRRRRNDFFVFDQRRESFAITFSTWGQMVSFDSFRLWLAFGTNITDR